MRSLSSAKVLVAGLGESGFAAALVAARLGAGVVVADRSPEPSRLESVGELESNGVRLMLGVEVPEGIGSYDLLVVSPGIPDSAPLPAAARASGVEVISELEFAFRLLEGAEIVAVTGTNGKTSTTMLIGSMAGRERRALTCGNIGNPMVGLYGKVMPGDLLVAEVSSFQLQNIDRFRASVGVLLNVAPDHLDWHRDFNEYFRAKARLVENMTPEQYLVYNLEDPLCREIAAATAATALGFASDESEGGAVWLEEGWIKAGPPLTGCPVLPVAELGLEGYHNLQNVMAAVAAALAVGISPGAVREAAAGFKGLEHRMEFVDEIRGVRFYNDSKATNPHASVRAIRSFDAPTVAIMGGRNKGLDFAELALEAGRRLLDGELTAVVLLGESAPQLAEALELACGDDSDCPVVIASELDESVERAYQLAGESSVVLFTPACASFDMFADYEDRGRAFKRSVARLKGAVGDAGGR